MHVQQAILVMIFSRPWGFTGGVGRGGRGVNTVGCGEEGSAFVYAFVYACVFWVGAVYTESGVTM